jgi:hypothetical protein
MVSSFALLSVTLALAGTTCTRARPTPPTSLAAREPCLQHPTLPCMPACTCCAPQVSAAHISCCAVRRWWATTTHPTYAAHVGMRKLTGRPALGHHVRAHERACTTRARITVIPGLNMANKQVLANMRRCGDVRDARLGEGCPEEQRDVARPRARFPGNPLMAEHEAYTRCWNTSDGQPHTQFLHITDNCPCVQYSGAEGGGSTQQARRRSGQPWPLCAAPVSWCHGRCLCRRRRCCCFEGGSRQRVLTPHQYRVGIATLCVWGRVRSLQPVRRCGVCCVVVSSSEVQRSRGPG